MNKNEIEKFLNENEALRKHLFPLGFLMTDSDGIKTEGYPFYSTWKNTFFKGYNFYFHPRQKYYTLEKESVSMMLIGHAYDPVSEEL